jgi:hypothetical protein
MIAVRKRSLPLKKYVLKYVLKIISRKYQKNIIYKNIHFKGHVQK